MVDLTKKQMVIVGVVVGLIVMMMAFSVLSYLFPSVIGAWFEQRNSAEQAVNNVYDWDNARENYEWFKNTRHDIEAKRKQLENYQQQKQTFLETYGNDSEDWARNTRTRYGRINDRIVGVKNVHDQLVEDYNSRAEQAHRAMFQCGLPYEMEKKFWLGDGRPNDRYYEDSNEEPLENPSECTDLKEISSGAPE
jgi:hypothetical protein